MLPDTSLPQARPYSSTCIIVIPFLYTIDAPKITYPGLYTVPQYTFDTVTNYCVGRHDGLMAMAACCRCGVTTRRGVAGPRSDMMSLLNAG